VTEHVILLDGHGRAIGERAKATVHGADTPLHLAFSCYAVDDAGRVLLAQRAWSKATFPGAWSNACCGHPQLGETLRSAVERRVREELGLAVERLAVALPEFTYRATAGDGLVEHERCPVLIAEVKGTPSPRPAEVEALEWLDWGDLVARARRLPHTLSPWSVEQIAALQSLADSPSGWLTSDDALRGQALLDRELAVGRSVDPPLVTSGDAQVVLDDAAATVDAVLLPFLAAKAGALEAIDPALVELTGEIRALVAAGGKRLRPAFVRWGHLATGAPARPGVAEAAAAVELLHTFALLHDDVMDRSATRRGRASAHAALTERHRGGGRLGDAGWFGISAAVLAGDLVFVWADELIDGSGLPPAALDRVRAVFTTLREEVIAGQHLDLLLASDPTADERRAEQVALLKSARYSVTRPLLLGAAIADPRLAEPVASTLRAYGDSVGLAFQLRDDILGLFGDPERTGKGDLDDLHEGKRTVLMLRALRLGSEAERRVLLDALGDASLDERGAARVREIVVATGARSSVEARIVVEHARALEAIDDLPEPSRAALTDLADLAIRRAS
jgi:isopentenyl-diphosphate delta-isomerase type 1